MKSPILNKIGTVFIPVRNIERSVEWYSDILGLEISNEILHGHLYVLPMVGTGIVLDSKIFSDDTIFKSPAFHFDTEDIEKAYDFMKSKNVEIISGIEYNHYFNFKDLDGNLLMVCKC
ncbi:VOC family protein [Sporosarcina sp. Te-1]|uniref:VOC family protein n=1 Tax=Sporosarcina sp. Te-1 TaxID=2818390 RepID=UPI001A9F2EFE|nr:VOC family protein [Sporosarcina sp. Te-1]QTD40623.1 VOC family protein [Sporosarcina sp. Te-1]